MGEPNRATRRKIDKATPVSVPVYDPDTVYVNGWQMSMLLGVQPASLTRWIKQWELGVGDNPIQKRKRSGGYSIPITYALVGRGWKRTEDAVTRQVMLRVLPDDPKPFLVVVGNEGWTRYTGVQASELVMEILTAEVVPDGVQVYHVGEVPEPPTT